MTNRILDETGLPVARQGTVKNQNNIADAAKAAVNMAEKIGYPVVVKPLNGQEGRGVGVNLNDAAAVQKAVAEAAKFENAIAVESYIAGDDHASSSSTAS